MGQVKQGFAVLAVLVLFAVAIAGFVWRNFHPAGFPVVLVWCLAGVLAVVVAIVVWAIFKSGTTGSPGR